MDEVLIGNIDASQPPRTAVREGLRRTGFKDSRFFNATDAQLADEIFAELQLRGVSLAKPHTTDHVVLLSEWDTFYGRMLSLTYGAVLAVRSGRAGNRAEFVKQYLSDGKLPENLHPYAYLRGLDGRTVCQAGSADCAQPKPTDQKQNRPDSFQQIVQWKPEANKAEGPGQFDYLSRTGALLEDLQRELQLSHRGEIKAIGIVGSDVYDVLLILQALRPRFPNALFFTTELDARLWNPKDREWARNLIVAGSYGLTLHRDLQQRIAPFRDSSQTALFAATLAALDTKGIDIFNDMSPRRFEIGNTTAVDLSVTPSGTPPLQPLTNSEESSAHREDDGHGSERLALLVLGLVGLLALYFIWNPLRRRTSRDCGFLSGDLAFFQSDVGGPDGAEKIVHTLLVRDDPVCRCLCTHLNRRLAESADEVETTDEMRLRSLRCNTLLELLNDIVHHVVRVETALDHAKPDRRLIERAASWLWRRRAAWWTGPLRLAQRFQARAFLDGILDDITRDESNTGDVTLAVAHDARYAARKLFWWRLALLVWLGVVAVVALILGRALRTTMWDDTFLRPDGEPFSLAAGTSAWPNIGLRVVSAVLALLLSGTLVAQLRMLFFRITREYRMPVTKITKGHAPMCVEASELWQKYHDSGKLWQRLLRAVIPTVIFFYFGHELMQLTGRPLQPLRGAALAWWSAKIRYFFVPFLFLTFLTVDAALQWRRFIHELAALPTHYPSTTLTYFQAQRGQVGEQYLEEWIDIQMIADLTEGIGGVLWYPCIVFVVMLASLNSWTDHWPTPTGLMLLLVVNFALSIASVVIVQRAAQRARGKAQESLTTKLKRAQFVVAASRESNPSARRVRRFLAKPRLGRAAPAVGRHRDRSAPGVAVALSRCRALRR